MGDNFQSVPRMYDPSVTNYIVVLVLAISILTRSSGTLDIISMPSNINLSEPYKYLYKMNFDYLHINYLDLF